MPQPKPSTIVLLLVLFACVALYVLGVGLGAQDSSGGGRNPISKEERQKWRERFIKPKPVAEKDLKAAGCVLSGSTARVLPGQPCQVDIAASGSRVRTVNVDPQSGSRVDVKLEPKGGPSVPASLQNLGERKGLDVPKEGATLSLTCRQVAVGRSECPVLLR